MSITSSTIGKRTFKVILLGDTSTGKTSIIERFVNNKFEEKDTPTIGIDFLGKNVTQNSTTCRLQLWDTAGQERYRSLIPSYLKDAVCAIFVFDVSRPETLENIQSWIDLFRDNRGDKTVMVICGNKSDIQSLYDSKMLAQYSEKYKIKYYEVSALTGANVENMFHSVIDQINALQQSKRKKFANETEQDLNPPMTKDNLKSEYGVGNQTEGQNQEQIKLLKPERKSFCCGL